MSGAGCPPIAGTPGPRGHAAASGTLIGHRAAWRLAASQACVSGSLAGDGGDDSGAALVAGWRSGEFADGMRRLLRGLLAVCRLASGGVGRAKVSGTDGRQFTAMGFQARPVPRAPRPRGSGARLDPCPGIAPRSARTRTHSSSPGSQPPSRNSPCYRERGRGRLPRLAAGSFICSGALAGPGPGPAACPAPS
jgi:hypothetical protein